MAASPTVPENLKFLFLDEEGKRERTNKFRVLYILIFMILDSR
jgi:hypothetical protein